MLNIVLDFVKIGRKSGYMFCQQRKRSSMLLLLLIMWW